MSESSSSGDAGHKRKDNRIEDTVIIISFEDECYRTLDWSFGGFRIGGYEGSIKDDAEFMVSGIGPDLDNIFDVRVDCQAIRVTDGQLSASFIEIDSDIYDILEALMSRREKPLEKLKQNLSHSSQADRFLEKVSENTRRIYQAFLKLEAATGERKEELMGVYRETLDIKNQGLNLGYELMTEICNELCLLIEKLDKAGPKEVEVIKLHVEAMKLIISQNIKGNGGDVGEEILAGLRQVCDKFHNR